MFIQRLGAFVALMLLVSACSTGASSGTDASADTGSGGELQATRWVLDSYSQDGALTILPETLYADARFDSSRVSGFSGCNEYDALYRAGGRTLWVSQVSSTMMACDETAMTFEQTFQALLAESRFYTVRRDTLTVFGPKLTTLLVFNAAPRNPLLGTWRVDSFSTAPGTVVAVLPGTELDVTFQIGSVGGYAGCNAFSGTYGTNGTFVRIGRLAITQMACDQAIMDQEAAFLAALQGAAFIEQRAASVSLTDRKGNLVVALVKPTPEAAASPTPGPTATATPSPTPGPTATPTPTASPTPKPTESPTPKPTPAPTASPTPAPSATPTPLPSVEPPASLPPAATCKLSPAGGPVVATITYPGTWSTLTEPAELACRYFDPAPITVPADPATLETAVRADVSATPYADSIAAATDPASWTVSLKTELNVQGTAVTCIGAIAASDAAGVPSGTGRFECLANVQTAGTVVIFTTGTPGDAAFQANAAVVGLMTYLSTFTAPG